MTGEDFRRVEAWLYSIPRMEIALDNLRRELGGLDTRAASAPVVLSNPTGIHVTGGNQDSLQDRWVEFLSDYQVRRKEIQERIMQYQEQLDSFNRVLEMLKNENSQLERLVKKKYIEKVKPDQIIWDTVLFVGKATFYRMRIYILGTFFECLPYKFGSEMMIV